MKQRFGLIKRPWGVYYLKDKITGEQTSLKTNNKEEALRLLQARNETKAQPHLNLALARVYMNGADPELATRTWQQVMENILEKKTGETQRRWQVAIKDRNLDCIRNRPVAETRPEHFDKALADGKVSTNVYLRRVHNHALGMDWLLRPVIPRLQWPRPIFKTKRAITVEEHRRIIRPKPPQHDGTRDRGTATNPITTSAATFANFSGIPEPHRPMRPALWPKISTGSTAPSATRAES